MRDRRPCREHWAALHWRPESPLVHLRRPGRWMLVATWKLSDLLYCSQRSLLRRLARQPAVREAQRHLSVAPAVQAQRLARSCWSSQRCQSHRTSRR